MEKILKTDVLICGAGAAGLTLAIELARRGVAFHLIEKSPVPFGGSRGKGIQPRTLEIFEDLGILEQIAAAGGVYPPMRHYAEGGGYRDEEVIEHVPPTPAEPYPHPLMVPQFMTERIMRERLLGLGHQPEFGCELLSVEQNAQGVIAKVISDTQERTLSARWLVAADGGRSRIRQALDIPFPGKTLGVRAIVADVTLSGLTRDAWHCFHQGDMARQIMLCPLAGTALFQVQGPVPAQGEIDLTAEGLDALVAERTGRSDIRIRSVSWASAYNMNARLAEQYRVGRIFLVGDAAHIHPPTGGQGLNTSVQDACNLGWKLAAVAGGAPDPLLDTYEEERRPVAAGMLGLATHLLEAQKRGDMRRGREVHQLDIGYAGFSLAQEDTGRQRTLLAGDRAPDARVRRAGGECVRLFDLLKGTHWTLLGVEIPAGQIAPHPGVHVHILGAGGDLTDEWGEFNQAYDLVAGEVLLVRPDGYIAAIVTAKNSAFPEEYFAKFLTHQGKH